MNEKLYYQLLKTRNSLINKKRSKDRDDLIILWLKAHIDEIIEEVLSVGPPE